MSSPKGPTGPTGSIGSIGTGYAGPVGPVVPFGPTGPFGTTGAASPVIMKAFPSGGWAVLEELVLTDRIKVVIKARARYQAVSSLQFTPSVSAVLVERRDDGTTGEKDVGSMSVPEILGQSSTAPMWQNLIRFLETNYRISVKEDREKIEAALAAAGKAAMRFAAVLMADVAMGVLTDEEMAEAKESAVVLQVMET